MQNDNTHNSANASINVNLDEIRNIYPHMPASAPESSVMHHPAILCFVHDPENASNALGQQFLRDNHDLDKRGSQPLAVAADMSGADFKIFDLTPPERQDRPCATQDLALALSYGMVTVEQGIDCIALSVIGQDTNKLLSKINNFDDIQEHGAMNVAACYGAMIAGTMAGIEILCDTALGACLDRISTNENISNFIQSNAPDIKALALVIIEKRATACMR